MPRPNNYTSLKNQTRLCECNTHGPGMRSGKVPLYGVFGGACLGNFPTLQQLNFS